MFVLRIADGPNKGKYFQDYDSYDLVLTNDRPDAKIVDARNASGYIMAGIDRLEVIVPEKLEATEEECKELATLLASGFFQTPKPETVELLELTIRDQNDPLNDRNPDMPKPTDYMSVFEWISVALNSRNAPSNKKTQSGN